MVQLAWRSPITASLPSPPESASRQLHHAGGSCSRHKLDQVSVTAAEPGTRGRHRESGYGLWWILDESPGGLGDREVWMDASALDVYGRGDAEPVVTVTGGRLYDDPSGSWLVGAVIRFSRHGDQGGDPIVYKILSRRWSHANAGRPYYVLERPD